MQSPRIRLVEVAAGTDVATRVAGSAAQRTPASVYEDWGERDPEAMPAHLRRWIIEVPAGAGHEAGAEVEPDSWIPVGDLSAHPRWYGPNTGSKAMNIGISITGDWRGRGLGSRAQAQLADLLHDEGIVRVEASTDVANVAEQRALGRAGFTLEGVAVGAQVRADGRHDLQVWSHVRASASASVRGEPPRPTLARTRWPTSLGWTYLAVAAIGLIGTGAFNVIGFSQPGSSQPGGNLLAAWFANPATSSLSVDLLGTASAASIFIIVEGRRLGMRWPWLYVVGSFATAVAFTFPLFLAVRERHLSARSDGTARAAGPPADSD